MSQQDATFSQSASPIVEASLISAIRSSANQNERRPHCGVSLSSGLSAYIALRLQLVRARQAAQLRQTDVSARIGLSVRHFARLENAEADPTARILCAWANAAGLRICLTDVAMPPRPPVRPPEPPTDLAADPMAQPASGAPSMNEHAFERPNGCEPAPNCIQPSHRTGHCGTGCGTAET